MPVNVGLTFLIGGILGWILVKLLRPNLKVEGLIIASCSSGIYHTIKSKIVAILWKTLYKLSDFMNYSLINQETWVTYLL